MNIEDKTEQELKAMWYDFFQQKAVIENNLMVVNQQLAEIKKEKNLNDTTSSRKKLTRIKRKSAERCSQKER